MRRTCAVLLLVAASVARAQMNPTPQFNSDHERVPKTERYANYVNDEQRARKEFEAAAKAMLSPKYRGAIAKFEPGDASDLIATWGEFITATGTEFVALQLALPPNSGLQANTEYAFFGRITNADGKEI